MNSEIVVCPVCHHHCKLPEGTRGRCKARINKNGKILPLNYGCITSIALDPIEKKPLYHFYPGSNILSVGSFGCNLTCPFCQNNSISMSDGSDNRYRESTPEELVEYALSLKDYNNIGIAFTYNEPLIDYEFVLDTEKEAKKRGLKTVVVTNGSINPEIFREVAKHTDAFNIDLKGLDIYDLVSGDLKEVKENIKIAVEEGSHVEVTTLVIPELNDSVEEITEIAKFLADIDKDIVLHITRFFPNFKMMDKPPTPVEKIYELTLEAKKYLNNVYPGNV